MLSKRGSSYDTAATSGAKRLRLNIADLFLSNEVSDAPAAALFEDAGAAGAAHVQDLRILGHQINRNRNLLARLKEHSKWPKECYAGIRVWVWSTQAVEVQQAPFLLIHEILDAVGQRSGDRLSHHVHGFVWMVVTQFHWAHGATGSQRSGIGRKASSSSPSISQAWAQSGPRCASLSSPSTSLSLLHTYDDVMSLVVWSLTHCCAKTWPVSRHDGGPWRSSDTQRRRRAGQALKNRASDWKMNKDIFQFSQHNELHGICWKCTATPSSMKDTSRTAHWHAERLDHWKFLERQVRQGKGISPLLYAPGFHTSTCLIDWLHCADLGVSQDWIGQVLWHMLPLFPGSNQEARVSSLWLRIQELYKVFPGPACLDNMTVRMIKPGSARAAKMKCYGAETRGLQTEVHHLLREMLGDDGVDGSIKVGTEHLSACYQCTGGTRPFAADRLAERCNRFAALYVALERVTDGVFRTKPKLHIFLGVPQVLGHVGTRSSVACLSAQPGWTENTKLHWQRCAPKFTARFRCPTCVERLCTAMGKNSPTRTHTIMIHEVARELTDLLRERPVL